MKLGMLLLLMLITLAAAACTAVGGQDTAVRSGANQIEAEAEPPATTEGPAPIITPVPAPLPIIVQAPGWDNQTWINTDAPPSTGGFARPSGAAGVLDLWLN